jgi:haloalkane dehalogenase
MQTAKISADFPYKSRFVDVYGSKMHYIEEGMGDPILFLHGIPTSAYLWRNIIPHLSSLGRCIAPDLIGMGKSAKPDIEYTLFDHIKYIDKFIETLGLDRITLVLHGWGSVIGFDYAMRNEKKCKGLAFYEAYLRYSDDHESPLPYEEQKSSWLTESNTTDLVTDGVSFVDKALPQGLMRSLSNAEMEHYREPFKPKGAGRPIYQYLRDLPNGDSHCKVKEFIADYSEKLTRSSLPKLLMYTIPGFITTIATVMWAKENLPNIEIIDIGEELHYAQESNPQVMGETISVWLQGIEQ